MRYGDPVIEFKSKKKKSSAKNNYIWILSRFRKRIDYFYMQYNSTPIHLQRNLFMKYFHLILTNKFLSD